MIPAHEKEQGRYRSDKNGNAIGDMVDGYYRILELENPDEFLTLTCAQLRTKARRLKIRLKNQGQNDRSIEAEEAQKKIGEDPIYRLAYDYNSGFAGWALQAPHAGRRDEIITVLQTTISNGNVEDATGAGVDGATNITDDELDAIQGGKFGRNWKDKINGLATNQDLCRFVDDFNFELERIAEGKNREKLKRQNERKVREGVDFIIDEVKLETDKKPNVRTRLELDWEDSVRKHQNDYLASRIEFQEAIDRINEEGQKIIRRLTGWRTAEFNEIVNDHTILIREALTDSGRAITDIIDKEGIETRDERSADGSADRSVPVLNPDGTPKKDGVFKKLGCSRGDCRATKKGWGNWEQHIKEHLGTDSRNTFAFVEQIRQELKALGGVDQI